MFIEIIFQFDCSLTKMIRFIMIRLFGAVIISFLLGTNYAFSIDGRGELKISRNTLNHFQNYLRGGVGEGVKSNNNKPLVFYVTADGKGSYFWYCSHGQCRSGSPQEEKKLCKRAYDQECFRFARKSTVRWKNGINPGKGKESKFSSKMTDTEILAKLTDLGFYGNTTSSTTTKSKITKKKKSDIVSNLTDLKKLLDDNIITQEEFEKAKKKLLN